MIQGMIRGYDLWVRFVGVIHGPWFRVSLHPLRVVIYPHLPRKCFNCWYLYHTWSALELACCWHCACCCQSGVRALGRAPWCRWSAAARCWCKVLLAVRVVCAVWSDAGGAQGAVAGAAWGLSLKVLLWDWCVLWTMLWSGHVGERMRVEGAAWRCCRASLLVLLQGVMLQGTAKRVRTVPNSCCKGANEGCCCTLQGAAVRVACPLWSWLVVPLQCPPSRCCS